MMATGEGLTADSLHYTNSDQMIEIEENKNWNI